MCRLVKLIEYALLTSGIFPYCFVVLAPTSPVPREIAWSLRGACVTFVVRTCPERLRGALPSQSGLFPKGSMVLLVLSWCFHGALRLPGLFPDGLMVLLPSQSGFSRRVPWCFDGALMVLSWCFGDVRPFPVQFSACMFSFLFPSYPHGFLASLEAKLKVTLRGCWSPATHACKYVKISKY
jgi:hypothetical protein